MDRSPLQLGAKLVAWALVACGLLAATLAEAITQDITSQFVVTRSGLVLNRSTNTFDQTVTFKNTSVAPALGPITAAIGALPPSVTLSNFTGQTPDGRPYVNAVATGSMLASGSTLSFVLKFANPQRISFSSALQFLYTFEIPANAPSLLRATAVGGTTANLIGRVEGLPNQAVSLQVSSSTTCVSGSLVGGAPAGGAIIANTDGAGYFGISAAGINPGAFVTVKVTAPTASPASLCLISSRDNDSWPRAFFLDGPVASAQDFIDSPGKARWYKLSVTPGQRIQVTLSGLPADYELAVFKDIGQVFAAQFNPATARANDLLKLTAEYAPSAFSPSAFSPSAFSPSAFSPDAYSPSAFSPSAFSADLFAPSAFSPSAFSPSAFSPSAFSPATFSPSAFSPSAFSPSAFSPSVFSLMEIAQAFSTAQTRSIIGVSATPGTGDESLVVNTWNRTGSFYVRVTGRAGAFNTVAPFTVSIAKGATTCTAVTDTTLTPRAAVAASGLKTVILANSSKVPLDTTLPGLPDGTLRTRLSALAARTEIKGVVVDVAGDARVSALNLQAANNPACPFAKNLVAEEIKGIVDSYRANPLKYVVLVGNDDAIPFFRSPDQSGLGQESAFVPPVQSNSPSEASLRLDFVLSQDRYGSTTSISLPNTDFPVPGLAVGRLIETSTEIAGLIDAYVAASGVVVPGTSLVTGYDFLEDAANAVRNELQLGTGATSDALITLNGKSPQDPASWNATQLADKLLGSRHDVIFLAGHFSANSALAADFTTSLLTTDLGSSTVDLTNSIVFSAGCHSGYNLVDVDAIPGVTAPLDWAQAFARKGASLIAGTGYQYGDTDFLEYSERLYNNFARQLRAGTGAIAVGEALVKAKLDYLALVPDIRGIHEKALLEATLFGLPMLGVNMPSGRGAGPGGGVAITPVAVPSGPAATLGLMTFDLGVTPSVAPRTKNLKNVSGGSDVMATWLSGPDGVVTKPGEPALPLVAVNVTPNDPNLVLRGIGIRGGTYVDSPPILPFSGAPSTELRGVHVPFLSPTFFPGRTFTPNYFGALAGTGGTELLVTPAQHRAANVLDGTSTQRKFTGLGFRLYYSANLTQAALSDAPTFASLDAQPDAGGVLFTAQVIGDPAAAVYQVWVTYTSDGASAWTSLDLSQCVAPLPSICGAEDSRLWKGRLASSPANLKFFGQTVSGVGLVSLEDNRGSYFGLAGATPATTRLALVTAPTSAAIGDSVDITVKLTPDALGSPVAGKLVSISVGGPPQFATTGIDGSASVRMPVVSVPGNYQITASFSGDGIFLPSFVSALLAVGKAPSSLTSLAPAGATLTGIVGGKTEVIQLEAVTFSATGPAGPTTIWANTDILGRAKLPPPGLLAGIYNVTQVSFSGNAAFAPSTVALSQAFNVPKLDQTIAFNSLVDRTYGFPAFRVLATANSGLPVTYTAIGACAAAGDVVQIGGVGSCMITASQPGDNYFNAAAPQSRTFMIANANQVITFGPAPVGVTVGQPLVFVSATSTSPTAAPTTNPIAFTSLTPAVCTTGGINGASLTLVASGPCMIAANQVGDANYGAAPQATQTFTVGAAGTPPATFTVTNLNDSNAGSLRRAIKDANAAAPGPNIVNFMPGLTGTILLTSGAIKISRALSIVGPGAASLTINGNANSQIFSIFATNTPCPAVEPGPEYHVSISGLRLTNASANFADSYGGAIYTGHSLALDSVIIDNSIARSGGGLAFNVQYPGQTLTITNSQFLNNIAKPTMPPTPASATDAGGAMTIQDCLGPAFSAGLPYITPMMVTIANSEIRGNSSQPVTLFGRGGAIRSYSLADITISDTRIVGNHVDAPNPPLAGTNHHGGAFEGTAKSLRIERSEIADNAATDVTAGDFTRSGGLHLYKTDPNRQGPSDAMAVRIINSTISGNSSAATAGAMLATGNVALELDNTTVNGNTAAPTRTGGIIISSGATSPVSANNTTPPTLKLVSSILANNSSSGGDIATNATFIPTFGINAFNSLIQNPCATCAIFVSGPGNFVGADPVVGPLNFNGGTTRTHALLPGSPAINTGSNPFGLATDQRGAGFPRVVGGTADMGAYEK